MAGPPPLAYGRWDGTALLLPVRVQPRSGRLSLGPGVGQRLKLALTAPPVDGKANAQARAFLAESFQVAPSRVTLVQGEAARDKLFRIESPGRLPEAVAGGVPR